VPPRRGRRRGSGEERVRAIFWILVGAAVLAFAVEGGEYGTTDLLRQRREHKRLTTAIDSLTRVVDSLGSYRTRLERDPRLQERIAREEFGMVRDKELLYRFIAPDSNSAGSGRPPR
jgi:cell division protein FtsB